MLDIGHVLKCLLRSNLEGSPAESILRGTQLFYKSKLKLARMFDATFPQSHLPTSFMDLARLVQQEIEELVADYLRYLRRSDSQAKETAKKRYRSHDLKITSVDRRSRVMGAIELCV
jgi:hypothetical protein